MSLSGILSLYPTPTFQYPFFTSAYLTSPKAVIFIGGLTNGMMNPRYLVPLSSALDKAGWRLVQMHWSGAYNGYGSGSLERDRMEMGCLVKHLRGQGLEKIVLMGHSTGSQDVLHYLSRSPSSFTPSSTNLDLPKVDGGIIQAPASDREYFENPSSPEHSLWMDQLPRATELVKSGNGEEKMGKEFCKEVGCEISAYRVWSLAAVGGDDDYFSSDIPLEPDGKHAHPLSSSFGKLTAPALALCSEKDEYSHLGDVPAMLRRWEKAGIGRLEAKIIVGANHAVEEGEARERLCQEVVGWLNRVIG